MKVWLLKNNLNLFGLNDKLLIHTVRTHVINYDCVFFIQNSCWENRVSSDHLWEGGHKQGIYQLLVIIFLGLLALRIKDCGGWSIGERETINPGP